VVANEPVGDGSIVQRAYVRPFRARHCRLDGKPKQETEVSLRTAVARELSDDDLAAIAVGAGDEEVEADPKADPTKLN
jgi:hypothetical protein